MFTILAFSWQCNYSKSRQTVISLGKLCKEHGYSCEWVSGQEPRLTKKWEEHYLQNWLFRTSCRARSVIRFPGAARLQHRECRIWRPQHHKIQTKFEVTCLLRETGAGQIQTGWTRMIDCNFLNCWRGSQKIQTTQKFLCTHTIQIRNVLRKWW